jgi:hypothetical protein
MIKKSLIAVGLLLVSTSATASDYFVGVDYLKMDMPESVTVDGESYEPTPHGKDNSINLKFGINNIANGRVYLQTGYLFDIIDSDGDKVAYKSTSINYDYYIPLDSNNIKPFVGAGLGYGKYYPCAELSKSDYDFNFKAGIIATLNKNAEFEVGYKVVNTKAKVEFTDTDEDDDEYTALWEIDSLKGIYIGFNYKF